MRKIIGVALTLGIALATVPSADARQGCGPGGHRGPYGHCRPNRGGGDRVVVAPGGALIVGRFYQGRGYWDGRRYWQNRYRHHGGWRYR
jgi:hypothetical protein